MNSLKKCLDPAFDQRGMTLIEIMLALLVLSTIVTMVSISLSGSVDILNATRGKGEIYHRAQVALLRISEDLASAVLIDDGDFVGSDEKVFNSEGDSLAFTSTAHVVFNRKVDNPGIALISYSVQEDSMREGELVLLRSDKLLVSTGEEGEGEKGENGLILTDRVRSVNFSYIDKEGEELESWTTVKDESDEQADRKLPVAVTCTLEFWVDRESETSIEFSTSVLLPVGLINAQIEQKESGS